MKTSIASIAAAIAISTQALAACPEGSYPVTVSGGSGPKAKIIEVRAFGSDCSIRGTSGGWLVTAPNAVKALDGKYEIGSIGSASIQTSTGRPTLISSRVAAKEKVIVGDIRTEIILIEATLNAFNVVSPDTYWIGFDPSRDLIVSQKLIFGDGKTPLEWTLTSLTPNR